MTNFIRMLMRNGLMKVFKSDGVPSASLTIVLVSGRQDNLGCTTDGDTRVLAAVVTGFLCSGKTTLLNHIFADICEFIAGKKQITNEDVIEVVNGRFCCAVRRDSVPALKRLHKPQTAPQTREVVRRRSWRRLSSWTTMSKKLYRLGGIITVVDAARVLSRFDEQKAEGVENESVEQLVFADRIILNKCDLLLTEQLEMVSFGT